jgi:hypothetical protein
MPRRLAASFRLPLERVRLSHGFSHRASYLLTKYLGNFFLMEEKHAIRVQNFHEKNDPGDRRLIYSDLLSRHTAAKSSQPCP